MKRVISSGLYVHRCMGVRRGYDGEWGGGGGGWFPVIMLEGVFGIIWEVRSVVGVMFEQDVVYGVIVCVGEVE